MVLKNNRENIIYLIIWFIIIALPVFTLQGGRDFSQTKVYMEWIRLIPFFLVFIINKTLLLPQLLLKKKTLAYVLAVSALVLVITYLSPYSKVLQSFVFDQFEQMPRPRIHGPAGRPTEYRMATNILILFLVVGFNNTINLLFQREKEEQEREQKDKIHLQTELSFLRNQISPHFFMNTLNNIHALIDFDTDQAQKSVIQLSTLMRHLLGESKEGTATIEKEFEFLKSYVDLMRIRYSDKVKITVELDLVEKKKTIPSLLFVSMVENAFKYGIDYANPCYISIKAWLKDNELFFEVKNSIAEGKENEMKTGIGLSNLEKQLSLLYDTNYDLDISENDVEYSVNLKIPLNDD